jgi:hypothetical protein
MHEVRDNDRVTTDSRAGGGDQPRVWIFHGADAPFAAGVFASRSDALGWVARHELTGIVTEYEVGGGCYDLAVEQGRFRETRPHHGTPHHVATFSPGLDHVHVRDGSPEV